MSYTKTQEYILQDLAEVDPVTVNQQNSILKGYTCGILYQQYIRTYISIPAIVYALYLQSIVIWKLMSVYKHFIFIPTEDLECL